MFHGNSHVLGVVAVRPRALAFLVTITVGLIAGVRGSQSGSEGQTLHPYNGFTVKIAAVNGTGCSEAASTTVKKAADNAGFSIAYHSFRAQVGGGAGPAEFWKNCQISIQVTAPGGSTYAIIRADYFGSGKLESGATGMVSANYYFAGSPRTRTRRHALRGPFDGSWHFTDTGPDSLLDVPCGIARNININTELRVGTGTAVVSRMNFLTMNSAQARVSAIYRLRWKRCS